MSNVSGFKKRGAIFKRLSFKRFKRNSEKFIHNVVFTSLYLVLNFGTAVHTTYTWDELGVPEEPEKDEDDKVGQYNSIESTIVDRVVLTSLNLVMNFGTAVHIPWMGGP